MGSGKDLRVAWASAAFLEGLREAPGGGRGHEAEAMTYWAMSRIMLRRLVRTA